MSEKALRILDTLAEEIRDEILDDLGREVVAAVFLGGSVASGRVAAWEGDDFVEIFSDLDIYVVVSSDCDLESARVRAGIISRRVELEGDGYRMFRRPDIGVFTPSTLLAQPARPGTVDLHLNHRMLHGDAGILEKRSLFAPSAIERDEALYLLENRLLETLELGVTQGTDESFRRFLYYNALKCEADVLSALLITEGRYDPDPGRRLDMLQGGGIEVPGELLRPVERASSSLLDVSCALKEPCGGYEAIVGEAGDVLLAAWRHVASKLYDEQAPASWRRLVAARCRGGGSIRNLRLTRIICRKGGIGLGNWPKLWFRFRRFDPLISLRAASVCEMRRRREEIPMEEAYPPGMVEYLDRLCKLFGLVEGGVFERARALYRRLA
jgi:hypothetical protein